MPDRQNPSPARRRIVRLAGLLTLLSTTLVLAPSTPAVATPVATNQATYLLFGRAFPDPHGCNSGPGFSPWAKGNVCATQFIQWQEALDGLAFLEGKFSRYMEVINLNDLTDPELQDLTMQSAGLPNPDLTRDRRDLYVVKVTDSLSATPENQRKHFAYALSIHGIERAGIEGGTRAIEDLVTWTACEDGALVADVPACADAPAGEGPYPKQILEPLAEEDPSAEPNPTAGEVLRGSVIYFVLANPDGWHRGEFSQGGVFFQRYNGNGMDLNRDWPTYGYVQPEYTPWSEPETVGFGRYLETIRDDVDDGRFDGAIDLHGQLTAPSFSFTLLGAGQRDFRKNARTVETAILTFRDSEDRLTWSNLIAPSGQCPGDIEEPVFGGNVPMCSDQWGTVWDTINYQVTGSFGDWMDSTLGLDAVGIDNEMSLSHVAPNQAFYPEVEQLHVDGNKGLIYSQIASLLVEQPVEFVPTGDVAYVFDPDRVQSPGEPDDPPSALPTQATITGIEPAGQGFPFQVQGAADGVHNGGLYVEATCTNAQGIGDCSGSGAVAIAMTLQYCEDDPDTTDCVPVASYFNQSPLYSQAGTRIDLNDPEPGYYRIQPNSARTGATRYEVHFTSGHSYPEPHQAPYDVSRMDFFDELNQYVPSGQELQDLTVDEILADPSVLDGFDSLVVTEELMPRSGDYTPQEQADYAVALMAFAAGGGNLVVTDAAVGELSKVAGGLTPADLKGGFFYAGWMDFNDGAGPTYDSHHLSEAVNKEGTAEGQATIGEETFTNRHQTYEPVPLGFYVGPGGSGNASCNSDKCDSPNWIVNQTNWTAAGGTTAARTLIRETTEPNSATTTGTSLGEIPVGDGVIRIAGSVLPSPTEQNHHPFGLSDYALTYTGYQVFENLIDYQRPTTPPVQVDLSLTKTDAPDPVQSGQDLTYTLTATNNDATNAATGVTIVDELPDAVEFKSASPGCGHSGGVVTCSIGGLAAGVSVTRQIVVSPGPAGTITNRAAVAGGQPDPSLPNVATAQTTVTPSTGGSAIGGATGGKCPGAESLPGNHVVGTSGSEKLTGTPGDDVICGLKGKDRVKGLGGDDTLLGGSGNDRIAGAGGNDFLAGNAGIDRLGGGPGNDRLKGGPKRDILAGGAGTDKVNGGPGQDRCSTGSGTGPVVGCENSR